MAPAPFSSRYTTPLEVMSFHAFTMNSPKSAGELAMFMKYIMLNDTRNPFCPMPTNLTQSVGSFWNVAKAVFLLLPSPTNLFLSM